MATTEIKIQAVAHSYWRSIKRSNRTFESLSEEITDLQKEGGYLSMKDQVRHLAKTDVVNGVISAEKYEHYIGEEYVAE